MTPPTYSPQPTSEKKANKSSLPPPVLGSACPPILGRIVGSIPLGGPHLNSHRVMYSFIPLPDDRPLKFTLGATQEGRINDSDLVSVTIQPGNLFIKEQPMYANYLPCGKVVDIDLPHLLYLYGSFLSPHDPCSYERGERITWGKMPFGETWSPKYCIEEIQEVDTPEPIFETLPIWEQKSGDWHKVSENPPPKETNLELPTKEIVSQLEDGRWCTLGDHGLVERAQAPLVWRFYHRHERKLKS